MAQINDPWGESWHFIPLKKSYCNRENLIPQAGVSSDSTVAATFYEDLICDEN